MILILIVLLSFKARLLGAPQNPCGSSEGSSQYTSNEIATRIEQSYVRTY